MVDQQALHDLPGKGKERAFIVLTVGFRWRQSLDLYQLQVEFVHQQSRLPAMPFALSMQLLGSHTLQLRVEQFEQLRSRLIVPFPVRRHKGTNSLGR